jgi:STE24 endopeptidase
MQIFTLVFLAALAASVATRLWLAQRHIRYMREHRDRVPVDFAEQITLDAHRRAADYNCAKTRLGAAHILLDAALLLLLTLGGGIQWLWDAWSGVFESNLVRGIALVASTTVILSAAELPLSAYRVFAIETRFGFNKMTLAMFIADLAKQAALGAALGAPLLVLVLWLMEQAGTLWWLYAWIAWSGFSLLVMAVYPTWIAPLFNRFTPLEDPQLKERIERLLARCGFKARGLFVMDGSRRSSHGNAYFTGFGRTKRIVFFDTLLTRLSGGEIEAVLAHELGHFKLRHVVKRMAWSFGVSLAFLWVLGYAMQQPWFFTGLGVTTPSTAAALQLFFLVVPVFTFLLSPLLSLYSRRHEYEADEFAARYASPAELVQALVKLYRDNAATLTPDPLHSAFYDSHPPASLRVARLRGAAHNVHPVMSAPTGGFP